MSEQAMGHPDPTPDPSHTSTTDPQPRAVSPVALWSGVVAVGLLVGWRTLASWDVWWHLAIGRRAIETGSTVPLDTFSFSYLGEPFVHKDLFADILFYGAFDTLGFAGIALIRATAVVIAALGIYLATVDRRPSPAWWFAVTGVFVMAAQYRFIPRPLIFTIALFAVMLGLIERARGTIDQGSVRRFARAMLPAIVVQWAWLNLHRGGLLGLVLLAGHALALFLALLLHRVPAVSSVAGPKPTLPIALVGLAAFVVAVLVGLLNPSGFDLYSSGLAVTHDAIHRNFISEWQPLSWEVARAMHLPGMALLAVCWLWLVGRLVLAVWRRKSSPAADVWHLGVLFLFTVQGVSSMRWLSYAYAASAIIVVRLGAELTANRRTAPKGLLLLAFLAVFTGVHATNHHGLGLGEQPHRYPSGAFDFAAAHELGANVHNTFVYGGYTTWVHDGAFRTLIDGRNDMLFPSEFFLRCAHGEHDAEVFAGLQAEYPSDWVLASNTPGRESFLFLGTDPAWMPIYWSEPAIIYVERAQRPDLEHMAFRFVHPLDPIGSVYHAIEASAGDREQLNLIGDEISRLLEASPDSVRAMTLLVMFSHHTGDVAARDAALDRLHQVAPDHPAVIELERQFATPNE